MEFNIFIYYLYMVKYKKRKKILKGGGNFVKYNHNNREIILIGVNHYTNDLTEDDMKKISDYVNTKRNVCYLIEFDKKLTKHNLKGKIKTTHEYTTKIILPYLKKAYSHVWDNLCIKGWDIRQSLLTQNGQNLLYSPYIINQTLNVIIHLTDKLPNNHKIIKSEYTNKIGNYLQEQFDNSETYHNLRKKDRNTLNNYLTWLIDESKRYNEYKRQRNESYKNYLDYTLKDMQVITQTNKHVEQFITYLRLAFVNYSDLIVLEKILKKNNNTNYVIFQGLQHFENIRHHLKQLDIN